MALLSSALGLPAAITNTPTGFNNTPSAAQGLANNVASNITGIISTKPSAKYASGARCILKMNGNIVGFAFDVSWRINTPVKQILTIDDYLPTELAPQRVTVDGTISALHIPGQSAGTLMWQADVLNFLSQQYVSIEVRDSATDQLMFFTAEALVTGRSEDLKVDSLSQVQLTWTAIGYLDERTPAAPANLNNTEQSQVTAAPQANTSLASNLINTIASKLPSF